MKTSPLRRTLAVAAVLAAALTGCDANGSTATTTGSTTPAKSGGTLNILSESSSILFDPAKSQSLPITSQPLVHRRLTSWKVTAGQPTTIAPDLATDTGRPSDGGRTWTFTLKSGLTFSDGSPITAADIKWGVERSFAPAFSGGLGYHKTLLVGAAGYQGPFAGKELAGIETPDTTTIIFRLTRPYGDWNWITSTPAFAPVPKGKGAEADYGKHPVASGPYEVAEDQPGVRARLVRNPHWNRATDPLRPALPDQIVFELGQQASVVSRRLIEDTGDDQKAFAASFVAPAQLAQIQGNAAAKQRVVTSGSGALAYLALNTTRGALTDVRVRQAFQYAVDKSAYQVASAGTAALAGDVATTLITPGISGRQQFDLYPAPATGDPAKAKQLLAQAGHPNGLDHLTLLVSNSNSGVEQAQAIQASLAKASIKVTIRALDEDAYAAESSLKANPTYDLTLTSWQPDFPSANANIQPLFASSEIGNGGYNLARYRNPAVDKLIEAAQSTLDPTEAGRKWVEIDRTILRDSPVVPLIYTRNSFLRGSKVTNLVIGEFPAYPDYRQVGLVQ